MQSELTPVQEVAFFIAREKVQDRIEKRKRELMDNLEACARKGKKRYNYCNCVSCVSNHGCRGRSYRPRQ